MIKLKEKWSSPEVTQKYEKHSFEMQILNYLKIEKLRRVEPLKKGETSREFKNCDNKKGPSRNQGVPCHNAQINFFICRELQTKKIGRNFI